MKKIISNKFNEEQINSLQQTPPKTCPSCLSSYTVDECCMKYCTKCYVCNFCSCNCEIDKTVREFIICAQASLNIILNKYNLPDTHMNILLKRVAKCDHKKLIPIVRNYIQDYSETSQIRLLASLFIALSEDEYD